MKAGVYCSRQVVVVNKEESALNAALAMREYHVGDVVIVHRESDKTIPLGIITDRDLVMEVIANQLNPNEITISDLIIKDLVVAKESDDIDWCIKQMKSKGVRRMPVINESEELVGILSFDDVVEYLSEQMSSLASLVRYQPEKEKDALD